MRVETWAIDRIKVRGRIRQTVSNLAGLKESMTQRGLINPITITEDGTLIAGARRLQAAIELGWQEVEAHVWGPSDEVENYKVEGEENLEREELTPGEAEQYWQHLRELYRPEGLEAKRKGAERRAREGARDERGQSFVAQDGADGTRVRDPEENARKTLTRAAKPTGYGATTLRRVERVRRIAQDPEQPQEVQELAEREYTKLMEGTAKPSTSEALVLAKIKEIEEGKPPAEQKRPRNVPREQRLEQIRELAAKDYSSYEIEREIGLGATTVRDYAREAGIEIPADTYQLRKGGRGHTSNKIVRDLALKMEAFGEHALEGIDFAELDLRDVPEWIDSLEKGRRGITQLINKLKELQ